MAWNSNKVWPLAITTVIMYSSLNADSADVNLEQIAPPAYKSDETAILAYGGNAKITPATKYQTPSTNNFDENQVFVSPVRTEVKDGINLFVTADLLYWTAREQMLGYVIKSKDIDFTEGALAGIRTLGPHAKLKNFSSEWNWGYRVGIGYNFKHDQWDLYFNWTHYQQNTTSHANVKNSPEQQFFGTWLQVTESLDGAFSLFPSHAKGKWELHYNTIDMEFGRTFGLGRRVIFRPHLGVRGAIIDQDFHITYKDLLPLRGRLAYPKAKIDLDNDFWGIGLRGGVKSRWMFSRDWGVFGNFAGSLLWGQIENKTKLNQIGGDGIWINEKHHRHTVKGNIEIALGVSWDYYFSTECHRDRYHLGLTLAWEQLIWFHQNEIDYFSTHLITTHNTKQHGNLGLSGVTLGARFDF